MEYLILDFEGHSYVPSLLRKYVGRDGWDAPSTTSYFVIFLDPNLRYKPDRIIVSTTKIAQVLKIITGRKYYITYDVHLSQEIPPCWYKRITKTMQLWIISLAQASVIEGCFYLEIYSLTILLQCLGLEIIN